jgi:hypothetical protein
MTALHLSTCVLESGLRWTARLLAAGVVGMVLVIFVGQGGFNPFRLKTIEAIQMTFFWTACIGLVLAWRWQLLGGVISLIGIGCFIVLEVAYTHRSPGLFFYLMLLPGLLFLLSALLHRVRRPQYR